MGGVRRNAAAAGPTTKSQALHRGKVGIRWVSLALQFWPSSVNDHSLWDKGKGENGREQVECVTAPFVMSCRDQTLSVQPALNFINRDILRSH